MGESDPSPAYELLRSLLEGLESAQLGCTVVITQPDKLVRVYANESIARIYGIDLETMQTLDVLAMFTPEQRERLSALRVAVAAGAPAPPTISTTVIRSDGTEIPVELGLGHATFGDLRATVVFMRDVQASKRMEEALRESEDRFRRLADASPDSITVTVGHRYRYTNSAARKHLGVSTAEELAAIDPHTLVPEGRREELARYLARIERGEHVAPLLHRVRTPAGEEKVLESSLSFMTFEGTSAIVSWTRDITERMQLQAELMKRDRLASVGLLAAGVAHEINNPLTALALQARRLRGRADDLAFPEDVRASLAQIDEAAQRMTAIIGDLLFMARPVEQPQAHVDVAAILSSTLSLLRAGRGDLPEITLDLGEMPAVRGYASKLAQVFLNVLKNALQAVEGRRDGRIRIFGRIASDRESVEIVVADNGPGIPHDVLPRIAQPFFTTRCDGTGLGLWMSQSIMAMHGGSLSIASPSGEGTSVTLVLPL